MAKHWDSFLSNCRYVDRLVFQRTSLIQSPLQVLHPSHWHPLFVCQYGQLPQSESRYGFWCVQIFWHAFRLTNSPNHLDSAVGQPRPRFGRSLHVSLSGRTSLYHASDSILTPSWEYFTSLEYEWSVLRGHCPYRWTIWVR